VISDTTSTASSGHPVPSLNSIIFFPDHKLPVSSTPLFPAYGWVTLYPEKSFLSIGSVGWIEERLLAS
jgi:hypothetical protein